MKKTAFQVIENAIRQSSMTITNIMENTNDEVTLTVTDGAGLTITVEYERIHPEDRSIREDNDSRLVITDEGYEDNFAITTPIRNNMRSLASCMRMAMDNIIQHAKD